MAGFLREPLCFVQFGAALLMLWMAYRNKQKAITPNESSSATARK